MATCSKRLKFMSDDVQESEELNDALSDSDCSLDYELEAELGGSMNNTADDDFLNNLCDEHVLPLGLDIDELEEEYDEDVINTKDIESEDDVVVGVEVPVHDPLTTWNLMKPIEGEKYESPTQLKFCLTNYALSNGYQLYYDHCDKSRLSVWCSKNKEGITCPFRLWASWMGTERSFQIKKLIDKHVCASTYEFGAILNPQWLGSHFVKDLIIRPNMMLEEMKEEALKRFRCSINTGQCHRAKHYAMTMIDGKLTEHYARLWDYAHELKRSNPGSTVQVGVHVHPEGNYFHRFYVGLKALRDGWKRGRRPVIGLDGSFLKGTVKGELLSAVGRDANNQLYPIAWAVVDVENKDNWKWFMQLLSDDLGIIEGQGLTIISDQHKGLVEAAKEIMPSVEHRKCARHIYANFKKTYSGEQFKNLFWAAATSSAESKFMEHMNEIKSISLGAYEHLIKRDPNTWCRAFFETDKACEAIENGLSECFNSIIVRARKKPIITMLEEIRIYVMVRICKMAKKHETWEGGVCPAIVKKLKKIEENLRYWAIFPSGGNVYEARYGFKAFLVDLGAHHCTCRMWEISGIPCVHACAAFHSTHQLPENYISQWFDKEKYVETYMHNIKPVNGSSMWEKTNYIKPVPPKTKRMPGRPATKRKKDATEDDKKFSSSRTVTCNNCLQRGHNARSCKNPKQNQPPKLNRKPGRPRIHEPSVRGSRGDRTSRGGRTGKANTDGAKDHVVESVEVQESQHIVYETQGAETQDTQAAETQDTESQQQKLKQQVKYLKHAGYIAGDIEEALSIEDEYMTRMEGDVV